MQPTFIELFTPKLVSTLAEGYGWRELRKDAIAGLTVAIVALPLSMAIAIAVGATPDKGLITAVVGGFVVSMLGGSRFQIGGPAGAFIPLMASIIIVHGYDGLVLATAMAGVFLLLIGYLRLGTFIKYIPYPVTVGFTTGIGLIILLSQVQDLLGLRIAGKVPADALHKVPVLVAALPTISPVAAGLALLGIGIILVLRRLRPHWPGFLIVVVLLSALTALFNLPIETIASRFGALPNSLPPPHLPDITLARLQTLLVPALSLALLGGIESLLSAVVADSMTGRRHRANCELVAQGYANIATALFGGLTVTGTIARTATNIRSGGHGPVAGMIHAVLVLVMLMVAAPLMGYVPLCALAAVLAVVAWNMVERHAMAAILRVSRADALILVVVLVLTVLVDLLVAIAVGMVLASFLFMHRMAESVEIDHRFHTLDGMADTAEGSEAEAAAAANNGILTFSLNGAFFYGSAMLVSTVLDRLGDVPRALIIDMTRVPILDTSGLQVLEDFAERAAKKGTAILIAGPRPDIAAMIARASGALAAAPSFPDLATARERASASASGQ